MKQTKRDGFEKIWFFLRYKIEEEITIIASCFTGAMPQGFPINNNTENLVNYGIILILDQLKEKLALEWFNCLQITGFIQTESVRQVVFKLQILNIYLSEGINQKDLAALRQHSNKEQMSTEIQARGILL